jgi:hypothetical protein
MIQFYLLSILCNAAAGYLLIREDDPKDSFIESGFRFSPDNETFRLILGIMTILTGLLKLLSAVQGDLPVIGDLVPALTGFAAGGTLILEYYQNRSLVDSGAAEKPGGALIKNKRLIGFVSLTAAALHFLFPSVLLL